MLGGAGTYAAAGLRLAARSVGIACGVGDDFAGSAHAAWFGANGIDTAGLEPRGRRTPRSTVVYHREDARTETPVFGEQHFTRMNPRIDRLPTCYRAARGYYIFRDHDAAFWREAAALRAATGAVVLWELHAAAADAAQWPVVAARLADVDLVSLNLAEGRRLCTPLGVGMPLGVRTPTRPAPEWRTPEGKPPEPRLAEAQKIAARLLAAGVGGVALRLGEMGALLARPPDEYRHIPAYPAPVVDATGAGNAFGGALLAAVAAGDDWLRAGCGAAAAASLMLAQHGPPPRLDACRDEWRRRRDTLLAGLRGGAPRGRGAAGGAPGSGVARHGSPAGAAHARVSGAGVAVGGALGCAAPAGDVPAGATARGMCGGGSASGVGAPHRGVSGAGVAVGGAIGSSPTVGGVPAGTVPARGMARPGSASGDGAPDGGVSGAGVAVGGAIGSSPTVGGVPAGTIPARGMARPVSESGDSAPHGGAAAAGAAVGRALGCGAPVDGVPAGATPARGMARPATASGGVHRDTASAGRMSRGGMRGVGDGACGTGVRAGAAR